jgi:hypothetical protein
MASEATIPQDTHLGAISHGPVSPLREYLAAQDIQALAVASSARVVVFPESVVPRWTVSTDLFWKPTIDPLRQNGKVVVIGALMPESLALSNADIHAAIEVLRTAHAAQPIPRQEEPYSYRNVAIIRGSQSGIFFQRVPVPLSVWKPFSRGGAPLHLGGPAVLELGGERAALLDMLRASHPLDGVDRRSGAPHTFRGDVQRSLGRRNTHPADGRRFAFALGVGCFWVPYLLAVNS